MSEGRTEREALLEARVKELEAAARASAASGAQDGVFETIWRTINTIVPPWLAVLALAVFIGHYGFEYYMNAQITAAETQLKNAKAAVEDAEAAAQNEAVNGVPMRLATARAQLAKTQAEASRAKAEATAKTAQVNDETLTLATAKAQLENVQAEASRAKAEATAKTALVNGETLSLATAKAQLESVQNQATLVRAKADAASKQAGLQTLAQREAVLKLVITQTKAADDRVAAAIANGNLGGIVPAACEGNEFANLLGCPAKYVRQAARVEQPREDAASQQTARLRSPAWFNCSKAKRGADYVICASPVLLDGVARLEDAYKAAHAARGVAMEAEHHSWLESYSEKCGLPAFGAPEDDLITSARGCVLSAINQRIDELKAED